jgi:hypothetical protein
MKTPFLFALLLGTTLYGTSYRISSAVAQVPNPNQPDYQNNERSTTGESSLGNFNPLNLIHNANFRRSRDGAEFQEDTQTGIDRAAEEFKRKQREQLQNQTTPAPETK